MPRLLGDDDFISGSLENGARERERMSVPITPGRLERVELPSWVLEPRYNRATNPAAKEHPMAGMTGLVIYDEFNKVLAVHVFGTEELAKKYVHDKERLAWEDPANHEDEAEPEGEFPEVEWEGDRTAKDMTHTGLSYELLWDSQVNPTASLFSN